MGKNQRWKCDVVHECILKILCVEVFSAVKIFYPQYAAVEAHWRVTFRKFSRASFRLEAGGCWYTAAAVFFSNQSRLAIYTHTHKHTQGRFWVSYNHLNNKSRVNSRSDLVAPSAQQVKTHGVVISESERTLQMSLSREKKKRNWCKQVCFAHYRIGGCQCIKKIILYLLIWQI